MLSMSVETKKLPVMNPRAVIGRQFAYKLEGLKKGFWRTKVDDLMTYGVDYSRME